MKAMRTVEEIKSLIQSDTLDHVIADTIEGQDLDFKEWSTRGDSEKAQWKENRKKILELAVCMANGGGGHTVFGIADQVKGKAQAYIGVPKEVIEKKDDVVAYIYQNTDPRIQSNVTPVEIPYGTGYVMIVTVSGELPPYTQTDGAAKVRQGDECVPLTGSLRKQMLQRNTFFDFSSVRIEEDWQKLISPTAMEYIRDNMQRQHSPEDLVGQGDEDFLRSIGALQEGQLTRGGLLLFGKPEQIQRHIPTHEWAYRHMMTDTDYSHREEGTHSIALAAQELEKNIQRDSPIVTIPQGMFHHEYAAYPPLAVREALMNAFVHRDYELAGAVMVKKYPSRLEISNPGTFLEGIHPDNILHHASTPRNPHLMTLLDRVRLVNRTNLGVPRIYTELLKEGKEPPVYEDSGIQIQLTMFASIVTPELKAYIEEQNEQGVVFSVDQLLILHYLLKHSKANVEDISYITQSAKESAKNQLSELVRLGILEQVEAGKSYILSQQTSERLQSDFTYERNISLDIERTKILIMNIMQEQGKMTRSDIQQLTGWGEQRVYREMLKLRDQGLVESVGHGRGAYYRLRSD